ncbi:MAG: flagellar basal body rod protein FlgB [Planctomycetota bacterium]
MRDVFGAMERVDALMDVTALRQKVVSGNLANVNTPNYTRRTVRFEEVLREARQKQAGADPRSIRPEVVEDRSGLTRQGGNNVVLEKETAELKKTELLYEAFAKAHSFEKSLIRIAIGGSGA